MSMTRKSAAVVLAVAVALTIAWGNASLGAKPSPPPPNLPGTVYYIDSLGDIWGMNGNGSNKQVVLPVWAYDYFGYPNTKPSSQVYGPDAFFDRWWLVLENDGRTYDAAIFPTKTIVDYPHAELYAIRSFRVGDNIDCVRVKLTDLFGSVIVTRLPRYSNDGADSFVSFMGNDISAEFSVDESGQTSIDYSLVVRDRLYRINFVGANVNDVAGLIMAGGPLFQIADIEPVEGFSEPTANSSEWSPSGGSVLYGGDDGLWIWDVSSGSSTAVLQETRTFSFQWSPVTNKILFRRNAASPGISSINPDGTGLESNVLDYWANGGSNKLFLPFWAPDGQTFLYLRQYDKSGVRKIYLYNLPYPPSQNSKPYLLTGDTVETEGKIPFAWVSNHSP